jgi:tetracycline repressor-like protein
MTPTQLADQVVVALNSVKRRLPRRRSAAFLEDGYAGSSVNRIAGGAGVSIKTLYRHFDDKGDPVRCGDQRRLPGQLGSRGT